MSEQTAHEIPPRSAESARYSHHFWDKQLETGRRIYFRILVGGSSAVIIAIFAILSIYWGALWKTPDRNLQGWVVDLDGALVGQSVLRGLTTSSSLSKVSFTSRPASEFPGGVKDIAYSVVEQHTWVAVVVNSGASARLQASYANPNSSYDGKTAITVYGNEARNENAFRSIIRPSVQAVLGVISEKFALQAVQNVTASANLANILAVSPQTIITPVSYNIVNLIPFDEPVASATTFVGLIYVLILSFFIVMIGNAAREASGLNTRLTLRSLILTRFASSLVAYFFLSLFYSLLSLAFQLDFTRKFGHGGFMVLWMLHWVGMLAVGLAIESMLTLVTVQFVPFFLLTWIITNVSVCILPIEVLPIIYRYGYAMPFYNISHAVRCIVFGTKNQVGLNFGILLAWIAISCISLPLFQWYARRGQVAAATQVTEKTLQEKSSNESSLRSLSKPSSAIALGTSEDV